MKLSVHFFRLGRVRVLTGLDMAGVLTGMGRVRFCNGLNMAGVLTGLVGLGFTLG